MIQPSNEETGVTFNVTPVFFPLGIDKNAERTKILPFWKYTKMEENG